MFSECKHLVISGGGCGGISVVGAIQCLIDNDSWPNKLESFSGCSVGAILCVLLALDVSLSEIKATFNQCFFSIDDWDLELFIMEYGFDKGTRLETMISSILSTKGIDSDCTLSAFYHLTQKDIYISTTNISKKKVVYLNHKTHPDLSLLLALRMSYTIPLYFSKCIYNGDVYVDGGIIDNFPLNPFEKYDISEILGIRLRNTCFASNDISSYIGRIAMCCSINIYGDSKCKHLIDLEFEYPLLLFDNEFCENIDNIYQKGYTITQSFLKKEE